MKKLLYFILGISIATAGSVYAVNISIPQATQTGAVPFGLSTGNYTGGDSGFSWDNTLKKLFATNLEVSGNATTTGEQRVNTLNFPLLTSNPTYKAGTLFYRQDGNTLNDTLSFYDSNSGSILDIGQELWKVVKNCNSGAPIANGTAVYLSGQVVGQVPCVLPAFSSGTLVQSTVVGITTEDIANNDDGHLATYGILNNLNTNVGTIDDGDILYLATTTTGALNSFKNMTKTKPGAPYYTVRTCEVDYTHPSLGKLEISITAPREINDNKDFKVTSAQNNDTFIYDTVLGYWKNSPFNTLVNSFIHASTTIPKTYTDNTNTGNQIFNYTQYTKEPTGFPNTTDSNISFNNSTRTFTISPVSSSYSYWEHGVKFSTTTATSVVVPVTVQLNYFYFDSNGLLQTSTNADTFLNNAQIATIYWNGSQGYLGYDRHGLTMDMATHRNQHLTIGTKVYGGFTGTFSTGNTFSMTGGTFIDEDNEDVWLATTTQRIWNRYTTTWNWSDKTTQIASSSGTNLLYDNAGTPTAVSANQYVAYWIFATNGKELMSIMGQRQDTTLANAQANNTYASLSLGALPVPEMKLLYRVIMRNNTPTFTRAEALDFRTSNVTGNNFTATAHNLLTGLDYSSSGHTGFAGIDIANTFSLANTFALASSTLHTITDTLWLPSSGIFNSSGNLGIGTITPSAKIEIYNPIISTLMSGDNITMKNHYLGAGWSRNLLSMVAENDTPYFNIGGFGLGQSFQYGYIGEAYDNNAITWLPDNKVGIGLQDPRASLEVLSPIYSRVTSYGTGVTPAENMLIGASFPTATTSVGMYSRNEGNESLAHGLGFKVNDASGNAVNSLFLRSTSGNVGVGTTASHPKNKLEVQDVDKTILTLYNDSTMAVYSNDSGAIDKGGSISLGGKIDATTPYGFASFKGGKENSSSGDVAGYLATYTTVAGVGSVERMRLSSAGNLGIGTTSPATALDVNGTITQSTVKSCSLGLTTNALGSITGCVASDISLKKEIKPLISSLEKLLKLNPVTYQWKDTTKDTMTHSGFIAQEVEKVFPSAVVSAGIKIKGVDSNAILSLVVKSFQDFYKDFQKLVARVSGLEEKLKKQEEVNKQQQKQIDYLLKKIK